MSQIDSSIMGLIFSGSSRWSELPSDLLDTIASKLVSVEDYARLRFVCKSWMHALPARPRHRIPCQPPWLVLPGEMKLSIRGFFSCHDGKTHAPLPELLDKRCVGSSYGFLAMAVEGDKGKVSLINPITRRRFRLPRLASLVLDDGDDDADTANLRPLFAEEVILSSDPATNPDAAAVILMSRIGEKISLLHPPAPVVAWCRVGELKWRKLTIPSTVRKWDPKAFYDGKLCFVRDDGGGFLSSHIVGDAGDSDWREIEHVPGWWQACLLGNGAGSRMMLFARSHGTHRQGLFELEVGDGENGRLKWKKVQEWSICVPITQRQCGYSFGYGREGNCIIYTQGLPSTSDKGCGIFRLSLVDDSVAQLPGCIYKFSSIPRWLHPTLS